MSDRRAITTRNIGRIQTPELLSSRLRDIKIEVAQSEVQPLIEQLFGELHEKKLQFHPHFWASDQWFSPEGVPGIAIPFYLLHERLKKIVRSHIYQLEGADREGCLKILRHEAGHVYDTAYKLSTRPTFRKVFGDPRKTYPTSYVPKPNSKNYVHHLELWYAQAHPLEDFAETFAVWLRPGSAWRKRYKNTGAIKKLEYVEGLMKEVAGKKVKVRSRRKVDPISQSKITLSEYLEDQKKKLGIGTPTIVDAELVTLFSPRSPSAALIGRASAFLRKHRSDLRRTVSRWTGEHRYKVDLTLQEIIERCSELKLKATGDEDELLLQTVSMLSVHVMQHVIYGSHRVDV